MYNVELNGIDRVKIGCKIVKLIATIYTIYLDWIGLNITRVKFGLKTVELD